MSNKKAKQARQEARRNGLVALNNTQDANPITNGTALDGLLKLKEQYGSELVSVGFSYTHASGLFRLGFHLLGKEPDLNDSLQRLLHKYSLSLFFAMPHTVNCVGCAHREQLKSLGFDHGWEGTVGDLVDILTCHLSVSTKNWLFLGNYYGVILTPTEDPSDPLSCEIFDYGEFANAA